MGNQCFIVAQLPAGFVTAMSSPWELHLGLGARFSPTGFPDVISLAGKNTTNIPVLTKEGLDCVLTATQSNTLLHGKVKVAIKNLAYFANDCYQEGKVCQTGDFENLDSALYSHLFSGKDGWAIPMQAVVDAYGDGALVTAENMQAVGEMSVVFTTDPKTTEAYKAAQARREGEIDTAKKEAAEPLNKKNSTLTTQLTVAEKRGDDNRNLAAGTSAVAALLGGGLLVLAIFRNRGGRTAVPVLDDADRRELTLRRLEERRVFLKAEARKVVGDDAILGIDTASPAAQELLTNQGIVETALEMAFPILMTDRLKQFLQEFAALIIRSATDEGKKDFDIATEIEINAAISLLDSVLALRTKNKADKPLRRLAAQVMDQIRIITKNGVKIPVSIIAKELVGALKQFIPDPPATP